MLFNSYPFLLTGGGLHPTKLMFPVGSLFNDKVTPGLFLRNARYGLLLCARCPRVGLNAAVNAEGFAPDGSYDYLGTVAGRQLPREREVDFLGLDCKKRLLRA